jgi:hypothetical protein
MRKLTSYLTESIKPNVIDKLVQDTKKYIEEKGYPDWHIYTDFSNWGAQKQKSTEQLKEKVGDPIFTEYLYGRKNVDKPKLVKLESQHWGKDVKNKLGDVEFENIPIKDVNVIQEFVFTKPIMLKAKDNSKWVVLFKYKGDYYLNDGNHTMASEFLSGSKTIKAKVIEVEEY